MLKTRAMGAGAASLAVLGGGSSMALGWKSRRPDRALVEPAAAVLAAPAQVLTVATVPPADPKVTLDPVESTILAQRKRIMGKKRSLEMVKRVATEVEPIVRRT